MDLKYKNTRFLYENEVRDDYVGIFIRIQVVPCYNSNISFI